MIVLQGRPAMPVGQTVLTAMTFPGTPIMKVMTASLSPTREKGRVVSRWRDFHINSSQALRRPPESGFVHLVKIIDFRAAS